MLNGGAPRTPTILLVDDDEDSRIIYARALEAAGFCMVLATDGSAGVEAARAHDPDAILLDIAMPRMDGRQALQVLRGDPRTATKPILAITAEASLHIRGDLEYAGFDAVLLKPVMPNIVVAAVRQALAERFPSSGSRLPPLG